MKKLILISALLSSYLISSCGEEPIPTGVSYAFHIDIVSGSRTGEFYEGKFTYDINEVNWMKNYDTVLVRSLGFNHRGKFFSEETLDYHPYLLFRKGALMSIFFLGGPSNERFGLNDGSSRVNFLRPEEDFVRAFDIYFGYLDENGLEDGAGKVKFIPVR